MIGTLHKEDNMCYLGICVHFAYIWSFISDLSRQTVLAVSLIIILFHCMIRTVKKTDTMC